MTKTHSRARGVGYTSDASRVTPRITFPTIITGCDLGFRTFRPGRNPKEHHTP